jgi:hypothetical protein
VTTPQNNDRRYPAFSRLLVLVAAVLMFLFAVTEMGATIAGVPALAWLGFGLCSWLLSMVI